MEDKHTMDKPRMGRPPTVGDGETIIATVRLSPEQDKAIRKAAKKQKLQKSAWIRSVLSARVSNQKGKNQKDC